MVCDSKRFVLQELHLPNADSALYGNHVALGISSNSTQMLLKSIIDWKDKQNGGTLGTRELQCCNSEWLRRELDVFRGKAPE